MAMEQEPNPRVVADNGQEAARWKRNKLKVGIRTELTAIESLCDRIGIQCNSLQLLSSAIPGFRYDDDNLRTIRLALGSIFEALGNVERLCRDIEVSEFGGTAPVTPVMVKQEYGNDLAAVEEIVNDLGVVCNAEAYTLGLVDSRRRPTVEVIAMMRFLADRVRGILG